MIVGIGTDIVQIERLAQSLEKIGMRPGRGLGQNFLIDNNLLDWIVRRNAPVSGEDVLEVGPDSEP